MTNPPLPSGNLKEASVNRGKKPSVVKKVVSILISLLILALLAPFWLLISSYQGPSVEELALATPTPTPFPVKPTPTPIEISVTTAVPTSTPTIATFPKITPTVTPTQRSSSPPVINITFPIEGQVVELFEPEQKVCVTDTSAGGDTSGLKRKQTVNDAVWTEYEDYSPLCFRPRDGPNKFQVRYRNSYGEESIVYIRQFTIFKAYEVTPTP